MMIDSIKINTQKGLFISFLLHSIAVFFYLFFIYFKTSSPELLEQKILTMEIIDTAPIDQTPNKPIEKQPEPIVEKPKPIEQKPLEPQKIVEPKPIVEKIEPIVEKPQPIIEKPKPIVEKPQPIAIQEAVKIEPKQEKVIVQEVPQKITPKSTPNNEPKLSKTDFAIIRDKVLSNLIYPNIARRMGWQGVVQIELTINENGKLISAKVHQSSGKPALDKSALDASLQLQSEQLPKPKTTTTLILPVAFNLKGVE